MSFGLRQLKKTTESESQKIFHRHLVVGNDYFAVQTYLKLVEKFGKSEVGFLGLLPERMEDLLPHGPTRFRGKEAGELLAKLYPEHSLKLVDMPALFYKDSQYKEFGGRAKSEKLLLGEEFYLEPRLNNSQTLMPLPSKEAYDEIKKDSHQTHLKSLSSCEPTELIENSHWAFLGLNGNSYECEKAYYAGSPSQLFELREDKKVLSSEMVQFCESTQTYSELCLSFVFKKPIADEANTVFIPLSYTHDWGHFVGEFSKDEEIGQKFEAIHFLDKNENTEEDISRKIRLLKRSLEKIYPLFSKELSEEFVLLKEKSPCLKIDDNAFYSKAHEWNNFTIVGLEAPLEDLMPDRGSFEYSGVELGAEIRGLLALRKLD